MSPCKPFGHTEGRYANGTCVICSNLRAAIHHGMWINGVKTILHKRHREAFKTLFRSDLQAVISMGNGDDKASTKRRLKKWSETRTS